jgi:dephospho-CoA kinase
MIKIGITGGIASGKSTATRYFAQKKLTFIFDADIESKNLLKSCIDTQKEITNLFGERIVKDNSIDFVLLAREVFSNQNKQKLLNNIMWPKVNHLIKISYQKAMNKNYKLFIVDAALLFEANFAPFFDKVLLIYTEDSRRIERAIKRNNLSKKTIKDRMKLQLPEIEKKELADIIITNNGDTSTLKKKIDQLYEDLLK